MTIRGQKFLVAVLVNLFLLIPLWQGFEKPGARMDEGLLLVYPELILKGQMPYRDFETIYGPGNPYALAGVYAVFGPGIFVERAVGLTYRILILAAVFGLAQRWESSSLRDARSSRDICCFRPVSLLTRGWVQSRSGFARYG